MSDPRKIERVLRGLFIRRGYEVSTGSIDFFAESHCGRAGAGALIAIVERGENRFSSYRAVSINLSELARELSHDL